MQNGGIDLLFPSRAIESLRKLRGEKWEKLISDVAALEQASCERTAFVLFMVRISGCTTCQSDSFRAMRGCVLCASTTIRRYKGTDESLINLFIDAKKEIVKYFEEKG